MKRDTYNWQIQNCIGFLDLEIILKCNVFSYRVSKTNQWNTSVSLTLFVLLDNYISVFLSEITVSLLDEWKNLMLKFACQNQATLFEILTMVMRNDLQEYFLTVLFDYNLKNEIWLSWKKYTSSDLNVYVADTYALAIKTCSLHTFY